MRVGNSRIDMQKEIGLMRVLQLHACRGHEVDDGGGKEASDSEGWSQIRAAASGV